MLKVDMKTTSARHLGKDLLITLVHVAPSFIIGFWRVSINRLIDQSINQAMVTVCVCVQGNSQVAFIMVCLHHHLLVERSLLGSPAWWVATPPWCFRRTQAPPPAQTHTQWFVIGQRE